MKAILTILLMGLAVNAGADTFILKDGARIEGDVTGEMDGALLIKTRYGSLTVNKSDIQEQTAAQPQQPAQTPQPASPEAQPPAVSTAAPVFNAPALAASTEAAIAASTGPAGTAPAPAQPQLPEFTLATVVPGTSTRLLVYSENGVAIATETYDAGGALLSSDGAVKDGTYTEYYANGALKTVKTMANGKAAGTLKAFYPAGTLQLEAYYLAGAKDGPFTYYSEDGKPLLEAVYTGDKLNGWKREYDAAGELKSETYYVNDQAAEPPKTAAPAAEPAQPQAPDSMVTVKTLELARGERFSFQLNGKYIGKMTLDKDFNIISQEGDIPDGSAKTYSKEGKLQKDFVFEKNTLKLLRVYEDGGALKATYAFKNKKVAPFLKEDGAAVKQ